MRLEANEIDKVEECGQLNGKKVSLIKTIGGFWLAVGKKKGSYQDEALSVGSHPAIVKYNLEKQFPDYQPNMMKSEGFIEPIVEKHSHHLSDELRKNGNDIFSIQTGSEVEFQITKHNVAVANVLGSFNNAHLIIEELNIPTEFAKAMAGATVEKAVLCKSGLKLKV